jgi:adenosylcobinamide-phosphate synthase
MTAVTDNALLLALLPLPAGWLVDRALGDPEALPHPVSGFGRMIAWGERLLNRGRWRGVKGGLMALVLTGLSFAAACLALASLSRLHEGWVAAANVVIVYYCLCGKTLAAEVKQVFIALDSSLDAGRRQVSRIVGRDTKGLQAGQIRTAALETLSENLSDGVVAPLFWYVLLGAPGMLAYKMVNTLDSMIGYKTLRYLRFGCLAARLDDAANYLPARLTAMLMILMNGRPSLLRFVMKYGRRHASPNSGYPESALAGILNCRFGGPNRYFGELSDKPFIGDNQRELTSGDMEKAVKLNLKVEIAMIILSSLCVMAINLIR